MIELLAPVGSREALTAAVEAGANAVYMGGKAFGARHYAPNFSDEELAEAVRYAHLRNVLVYITVNTLVDDNEISTLREYLQYLYTIGVDAIIVQDIGVAIVAKRVAPGLDIHASTQMTVHNLAGVEFLASQGFTRVVLAREVSLEDIAYICKHSPVEIETFIHGALCISYSGQCLMSSMIGGRSGNRGRCAQPCRLPYTLIDCQGNPVLSTAVAGEYLLSPRDFNTIDILPQLIDRGVVSFKIEGRMKRPEYVAVVVKAYRQAIDTYLADQSQYKINDDTHRDLAQVFNRDFTTAYLQGKQGKNMISDRRPNNRGVRIGRVLSYDHSAKQVTIKLDEPLSVGDMIEVWVKVGGRVTTTVSSMLSKGQQVTEAPEGSEVTLPINGPNIRANDRVFRTFDAQLMSSARSLFQTSSPIRRIAVDAEVIVSVNQPLRITLQDSDGYIGQGQTNFIGESAQKRPLTEESIHKQIDRLGSTIFSLRSLLCHIDGQVMVPISEINEARRQAVENLEKNRLEKFERSPLPYITFPLPPNRPVDPIRPELTVYVDNVRGVQSAVDNGADWIVFGGENYHHRSFTAEDYRQTSSICRAGKVKILFTTPRIIKEWQIKNLEQELGLFAELQPDAVGIANVGTLPIIQRKIKDIPLHGEFSLNVYNTVAISFFQQQGIHSLTVSPELTFQQLENLVAHSPISLECIVHGRLPLMISEYCAVGSYLGNLHTGQCSHDCSSQQYGLKDRKGEVFPVVTDQFCRMHILNAMELNMAVHVPKFGQLGINRIRIEAKQEDPAVVGRITRLYRQLLNFGADHPFIKDNTVSSNEHHNITRGHYFRGVL